MHFSMVALELLACLTFLHLTYGAPESEDDEFCKLFVPNDMVDDMLNHSRKLIQEGSKEVTDLLRLPRVEWMKLRLTGGLAYGMDSLTRLGDATSKCSEKSLDMKTVVRAQKPVIAAYHWHKPVVFEQWRLGGLLHVWMHGVVLSVEAKVPLDGDPLSVDAVRLLHFESVGVKLTGLGLLNSLKSRLATYIASQFRSQVISMVQRLLDSHVVKENLQTLVSL